METKLIAINKIETNNGQVEGLPKNPRFIKDEKFERLKKSIQDLPEMLALRECLVIPHNKKFVLIAGNMRYRASKELGYTEIPCKIVENLPMGKIREIAIKDNLPYGELDYDILANEWNADELVEWGLDIPNFDNSDLDYSEKNKEIDLDENGKSQIVLNYTSENFIKVKTALSQIASTPEQAIWKLLNFPEYETDF